MAAVQDSQATSGAMTGRAFRKNGDQKLWERNVAWPRNNGNTNTTTTDYETQANAATEEGRRIYVGHLNYAIKKHEIFELFEKHGFPAEKVDMSVDPFTSRNPSFCFVELRSAGRAARAIHDMNGLFLVDRQIVVNLCLPMRHGSRESQRKFNRYTQADEAHEHWEAPAKEGRRIWVGGLPKPRNQFRAEQLIAGFLEGFNVTAISKTMPAMPYTGKWDEPPDNPYFAFVDLSSAEGAQRAVRERDGSFLNGSRIKVKCIDDRKASWKVYERQIIDIITEAKERAAAYG